MKRYLSLLLGLVSCHWLPTVTPDFVASWEFLQEVGGISLGAVEKRAENSWHLSLNCDVSGLQEITIKPRKMNSALVVRKVSKRIEDQRIILSLFVGAPKEGKHGSSSCPPAMIQDAQPGTYEVFYDDPAGLRKLGSITLN